MPSVGFHGSLDELLEMCYLALTPASSKESTMVHGPDEITGINDAAD
jgi:hypothetical protein